MVLPNLRSQRKILAQFLPADFYRCVIAPSYTASHSVLTNPVYASAYTYGKSHRERYVDDQGRLRQRSRLLPMAEWPVLLPEHHLGYIDWATCQANQARIDANVHLGSRIRIIVNN
jgi:hypothetical protein